MDEDEWKLCVDWLVRCELLARDHRLAGPDAQVFDFVQLIRDGVLLCHLLIRLSPGCMNTKDYSQRPQMSQFLCLKNIRVFLKTCQNVFGIPEKDLFDPSDLFEVKDFGKVINTLSLLSCSEEAQKSQILGFSTKSQTDYHPLHTLASRSSGPSSDVYDLRDEVDVIYEDLCSQSRKSSIQGSAPVTKRDYCIKELIETEKNYLEALRMIIDCFIKRLRQKISEEDCQMLFMGVENLFAIHSGFYSDLSKACSSSRSFSYRSSQVMIADCFIKWKEKFLAYGEFCSNLPKVQSILDKLCQNASVHQCIVDCQKEANGGRFRLRDLLSVPMQRVLKYHLLLKELIKNTDQMHPERKSLERALEEMQDLSGYVNEVKRDNENLQWIEDVERSIIDLVMPPGTTLKDYGRLRKDGELRVKRHTEKKERNLMIFLFDKVMLICKIRMRDKLLWGESYNYKDVVVLSQYSIEENVSFNQKEREKMAFSLVDKKTKESCLFVAKTIEVRNKWVEEITQAHDNICPAFSSSAQHEFVMNTYDSPTICDVCRKLLKGVFFQGYRCMKTGTNVHKGCMKNAEDVAGPPTIPPKKDRSLPSTPLPNSTQRSSKVKVKAISTYQGLPAPPNNQQVLTFDVNDVFFLTNSSDDHWWKGRKGSQEGSFPKSFVIVMKTYKQQSSSANQHSFGAELQSSESPSPTSFSSQSCRLEMPCTALPKLSTPRPSAHQPPLTASAAQCRRSLPLPPTLPVRESQHSPQQLDGDAKPWKNRQVSSAHSNDDSSELSDLGEKIFRGIESLNGSLQELQFNDGKFSSKKLEVEKQAWQLKYQIQQQSLQRLSISMDSAGENSISEPWFMGELSRQEAAKFLEKTPSGTFLVRVSDSGPRRGEYALSIRYGLNNPVKHIKLQKSTEGMFYLVETKMFRGISELIHFYQTNSLERSFPEVPIPLGIPYLEYTDLLGKSNGGGSVEVNTSPGEQHIVGYCMAHLDFLPNEPNQISFKAGDKIAILSKSPGQRGFWMGKLDDKVGFFPSEFVKEINCTV